MLRTTSGVCVLIAVARSAVFAQAPLERRDETPLVSPDPLIPPFTGRMERGVQVNVDAQGRNIRNDAANEPSLAIDPTAPNRMVICWRQFDSILSNFRQAGYAFSRDGGRTWRAGRIMPGVFRTDPVVRANAEGVFFWSSQDTNFDTFVHRSFDAGNTWAAGVPSWGSDKSWMVIDRTSGPGHGFIYHWSSYNLSYTRSTDGGLSFEPARTLPVEVRWGSMAIGLQGEAFLVGDFSGAVWTNANVPGATPLFRSLSHQFSVGFSATTGPNPAGLLGQANIAIDSSSGPRRGWIYVLASTSRRGADPSDAMFRRSIDNGTTWSTAIPVNSDLPHPNSLQWFGTMSIAPNGRLDVVWNDTRESLNPRLSRTYYRSSNDGGTTWGDEVVLTPAWDSWVGWPGQNKIGDYYDMESDDLGASLAFATTLNGEQDVYFMRIGPDDCNRNAVADDAEFAANPALDCNHNGILDSCEIAAGVFADRDHDGVLDVCRCPVDLDDGTGTGHPDGGVTADDLTYFLGGFLAGSLAVDLDDGTGTGSLDGGVTIDDLLYFLTHFTVGC